MRRLNMLKLEGSPWGNESHYLFRSSLIYRDYVVATLGRIVHFQRNFVRDYICRSQHPGSSNFPGSFVELPSPNWEYLPVVLLYETRANFESQNHIDDSRLEYWDKLLASKKSFSSPPQTSPRECKPSASAILSTVATTRRQCCNRS